MLIYPRSGERELDGLPGGYFFSGAARRNYMGIDHHRQYSPKTAERILPFFVPL
jgi:hypothetical protein